MKQILFIMSMLLIATATAWPLQILPNGTLIDHNTTINGTPVDIVLFNDSYFFIPKEPLNITNVTNFYNITNITYQNVTQQNLTNCTLNYFNDTVHNETLNYYYFINGSNINNFTYTKAELDSKFVGLISSGSADEKYGLKSDLSSLTDKVNNINVTSTTIKESKGSDTWIWISIVIIGILALVSLFWSRE